MVKRKTNSFLLAALVFLLAFCTVFTAVQSIAYAESGYSGVLDDLQKDDSFDESHYPAIADDYSLKIIQIAESTDGELFLYVYQPSGQAKNLIASSINISTTINDEILLCDKFYLSPVRRKHRRASGRRQHDNGSQLPRKQTVLFFGDKRQALLQRGGY